MQLLLPTVTAITSAKRSANRVASSWFFHTAMLLPDTETGSTQPSSGPSSSPRTSSSAARPPPPPSYLSARSADVILSEVRPTRIKTEALRSVNVLLDELLWLILGCARSFSPDRLRTGLLKVLPTVLGKDALLEAEVELRAYIERNPPALPLATDEATIQKFPLQQAFEVSLFIVFIAA
jgi:hypothetical protein